MPKSQSDSPLVRWWEILTDTKSEKPLENVWELVSRCKTRAGYISLAKHAGFRFRQIKRLVAQSIAHHHTLDGKPVSNDTILGEYAASVYAFAFVRGMQLGREIERERGNDTSIIIPTILKHSSVRRLLLRHPKATTLEVCRALDDEIEELPWPKLRKYITWEAVSKRPIVKMAITDARKAAIQEVLFSEFLAVAKGAGDEGSIVKQFRLKKFGYPQ
jgi:hypothetical protein